MLSVLLNIFIDCIARYFFAIGRRTGCYNVIFIFCLVFLGGCTQSQSTLFTKGQNQGRVEKTLKEVSGLVSSIRNEGYLWAINDGGNSTDFFLLNSKAKIVMTCRLVGAHNRDWESITITMDSENKNSYLYIGDTGDNEEKHDFLYVYRIIEPLFLHKKTIFVEDFTKLTIQLPDGKCDIEAMASNPKHESLYFFSKREQHIKVYQLHTPFNEGVVLVPQIILTLPYLNTVAADFSFDGSEFLLKTYDEIMYWKKSPHDRFEDMVAQPPNKLAYSPEPQGETIAWALDGSGFFTLSESTKNEEAFFFYYKRN